MKTIKKQRKGDKHFWETRREDWDNDDMVLCLQRLLLQEHEIYGANVDGSGQGDRKGERKLAEN